MKKLLLLTTVAMLAAVPAQAATVGPGRNATASPMTSVCPVALSTRPPRPSSCISLASITLLTDLEGGRSAVNDFAIGGINDLTYAQRHKRLLGHFRPVVLPRPAATEPETSSASTDQRRTTSPALPANSTLDISFTLNVASGNFLTWAAGTPAFKIRLAWEPATTTIMCRRTLLAALVQHRRSHRHRSPARCGCSVLAWAAWHC